MTGQDDVTHINDPSHSREGMNDLVQVIGTIALNQVITPHEQCYCVVQTRENRRLIIWTTECQTGKATRVTFVHTTSSFNNVRKTIAPYMMPYLGLTRVSGLAGRPPARWLDSYLLHLHWRDIQHQEPTMKYPGYTNPSTYPISKFATSQVRQNYHSTSQPAYELSRGINICQLVYPRYVPAGRLQTTNNIFGI